MKTHAKIILGLSAVLAAVSPLSACTGVQLIADDGSVIRGRTMEFTKDLGSDVIVIPRNYDMKGNTPDESPGLKWTTKYAATGANFAGQPFIADGVNEKGLAAGAFFFAGFAKYQPFEKAMSDKTLMSWELPTWILTSFSSVEEVRKAVTQVQVCDGLFKPWKSPIPLHFVVYETGGKSIVLEYLDGKLNIFDNPIGIITNNPQFPWHLMNLRNYIKLSDYNAEDMKIRGHKIGPLGLGSGMIGIPGDFSPPSRFIRATMFSNWAIQGKNGQEAVKQAFHVLRSFDIPAGTIREPGNTSNRITDVERTQWTTVCDLKARKFYYWTENDSTIRMCDLMKCNLDAKKILGITMDRPEQIEDVSSKLK